MRGKLVTVFGGSGFIGRYVVRALCKAGARVRVAMRRPHLGAELRICGDVGQVQVVQANVRDPASVARALDGADAAVNLVGLLFEKGRQTFDDVQAAGAANVGAAAKAAGVSAFVQMSAIGADPASKSAYGSTKAQAEAAVRDAFPAATVLRPSIVFGPEDDFFNRFADMAKMAPALPLIGGGVTRFQPVFVGDVAAAVVAALGDPAAAGKTYELGGPRIYSFRELLEFIMRETARPRILVNLPFPIAQTLGKVTDAVFRFNPFAGPPLTGDQVEMLKTDNVVADGSLTLADLGVAPLETVEAITPSYLYRFRPYGQFQTKSA